MLIRHSSSAALIIRERVCVNVQKCVFSQQASAEKSVLEWSELILILCLLVRRPAHHHTVKSSSLLSGRRLDPRLKAKLVC